MPIRFARIKCRQCDTLTDVRKMVEVQTWYSSQKAAFWDTMCCYCAQGYCDFMHTTYPCQETGVEVLIHPL